MIEKYYVICGHLIIRRCYFLEKITLLVGYSNPVGGWGRIEKRFFALRLVTLDVGFSD